MVRLYFWIRGAPENRPGGPWWCRDFENIFHRRTFLNDVRPYLYAPACTNAEEIVDPENVRPPATAEIFYPQHEARF